MTTAAPCWRPRRSCAASGSAEHGANSACRSDASPPASQLPPLAASFGTAETTRGRGGDRAVPVRASGRNRMRTGRQLALLLLALGAMFLQQTFAALGKSLTARDRAGHHRRPAARPDMARRLRRPRGLRLARLPARLRQLHRALRRAADEPGGAGDAGPRPRWPRRRGRSCCSRCPRSSAAAARPSPRRRARTCSAAIRRRATRRWSSPSSRRRFPPGSCWRGCSGRC